jgi:ATP-dependent RNA helicase DDX47/RRP3
MDFEAEIDQILKVTPRDRVTALFSATMTTRVAKLQRACLRDPVKVEACTKYATVATLRQQYAFVPAKHKDAHVAAALTDLAGCSAIIFARTCDGARRLALTLRALGFGALPIHGQMSQPKRLAALAKFKAGERALLVATDVASRGLDIPSVDVVINYDVPINSKDYVHRVGRTARAGRSGRAVTFVTQYDVEPFQRIEAATGVKMEAWDADPDAAALLLERVGEAQRLATAQMREADRKKGGARKRGAAVDDVDADDLLGGRRSFKKKY